MIKALSFDVFDTTLSRDVLAPSDVFPRIGARLLAAHPDASLSAVELGRLRAQAEVATRSRVPHEEITLEEIWRELAAMLGWEWSERLVEAEIAEEAACLAPVESTRALVEAARARGFRVLFVTDTYFPRDFMEGQLARFGLFVPGDGLYVSSEFRKTKNTGKLFAHVLAAEKLAPHELRHHGDNPHSDVRVPRRMGIAAVHVRVPVFTRNEEALVAAPWSAIPALRDAAGAARQFRQAPVARSMDPGVADAAGAFLGPFCGLFAAWALERARAHGLRRLHFCARDCQMTWKAARALAGESGGVDCRYLYVSRQALFLPSVRHANREELRWLRRPFERPLLARILAKLELDPAQWGPALKGIGHPSAEGIMLEDEADWERLWSAIEGPLRAPIEAKAAARRAAALAYFRAEGLVGEPHVGLVDIGWHLTCQASLGNILAQAEGGARPTVRGFYLQLNGDRLAPTESGPAEFLFTEPPADLDRFGPAMALHHMDAFLEHVMGLATHGSTVAYALDERGAAAPVLSAAGADPQAVRIAERHHEAVEAYVGRYAGRIVRWASDAGLLPLVLHRVADAFFRHATRAAVASLRHVAVSIDQNSADLQPLMRPISWWEAILPIFPARLLMRSQKNPYYPWPHGRRLFTSGARNATYRAMRLAGRARSWLWHRLWETR